jgi:hypothetical protein
MDRSFSVSESRAASSLDGYAERSKNSAKPKRNVINMGGCYWNQKEGYVRRPLWGTSRTLKGDGNHPAGVIIEYDV